MPEGITGYNCEAVTGLGDAINQTAIDAGKGIIEILHNEIVIPMSTVWYAPEAVEFFEKFAGEWVKGAGTAITEHFQGFRDVIQQAGTDWSEATKGEAPNLREIESVDLTLTVSEIQGKNSNGDVIINEEDANGIVAKLPEIEQEIKDELEGLAQNLSAEAAFMGHGQASAISTCFVKVTGEVHKIFAFLSGNDGGDVSLSSEIKKSVEKYQSISNSIASGFSSVE